MTPEKDKEVAYALKTQWAADAASYQIEIKRLKELLHRQWKIYNAPMAYMGKEENLEEQWQQFCKENNI